MYLCQMTSNSDTNLANSIYYEVFGSYEDKELDVKFQFNKNFKDLKEAVMLYQNIQNKHPLAVVFLEKRFKILDKNGK